MATTVTSPTLDIDNTTAKLAAVANLSDYWDQTEKRYRSGIIVTTISDINWTGTEDAAEEMDVVVQPPNYHPGCHNRSHYEPAMNSNTWNDGMAIVFVTALNYGMPGPSARMEGDETITLVEATLEMPAGTESSVAATMTFNNVFTEFSPYASLTSGTAKTATLTMEPEEDQVWGMISHDVSSGSEGCVIVQLTSLVTSVLEGFPPGDVMPMFSLNNTPQTGGQSIAGVNHYLPNSAGRTRAYRDMYTYIFGLNDGKIDANGTPLKMPGLSANIYSLCNFGFQKVSGLNTAEVSGTLSYLVRLVTI